MWPEEYIKLFRTNEFVTEEDLHQFQYLLRDDVMLMGLVGKRSMSIVKKFDFAVIEEPLAAQEMMVTVLGVGEHGKYGKSFDNFPYIVSAGVNSFAPDMGAYEESRKLYSHNMSEKSIVLGEYLDKKIEKIALYDSLMKNAAPVADEGAMRNFVYDIIPNEIEAYLDKVSEAMYMGGLERWPVVNRLYQALATGGLPTGWVGTSFDDGGDPYECMQLFFIRGEEVEK